MGQDSEDPLEAEARKYSAIGPAAMVIGDIKQDWEESSAEGIEESKADWADNTSSTNLGYAKSIFSRGMSKTTAL
jgi:hypothetical protein